MLKAPSLLHVIAAFEILDQARGRGDRRARARRRARAGAGLQLPRGAQGRKARLARGKAGPASRRRRHAAAAAAGRHRGRAQRDRRRRADPGADVREDPAHRPARRRRPARGGGGFRGRDRRTPRSASARARPRGPRARARGACAVRAQYRQGGLPELPGAARLRRRSRGCGHPALRGGAGRGTAALHAPVHRPRIACAQTSLLRRARRGADRRRAGEHAAPSREVRRDRRRGDDGHGHRDQLPQRRHPRAAARSQPRVARQGCRAHPRDLRRAGQEGQAHAGEARRADVASFTDARLRRSRAVRHRDRGGLRGHGRQGEGVPGARRR